MGSILCCTHINLHTCIHFSFHTNMITFNIFRIHDNILKQYPDIKKIITNYINVLHKCLQLHIRTPHGPVLVCPPSSLVNEEVTSKVSIAQVLAIDHDMVEALRAELAKLKSDHELGLEYVILQYTNNMWDLKEKFRIWLNLWVAILNIKTDQ